MKGKGIGTIAAILLMLASPALSAEYQGQVIDGKLFPAKIYSYGTGGVFDAQVEFRGDIVTVRFASGGQLMLRLDRPTITNLSNIVAYGGVGQFPLNRWLGVGLDTSNGITGTLNVGGGQLSDLWHITLTPEAFQPRSK